jgi:tetratricopeptide (TPR) repeat protein
MQNAQRIVRASSVMAATLLASCAAKGPISYRPAPNPAQAAGIQETRAYVESRLRSALAYDPRTQEWTSIESARVTPTQLVVVVDGGTKDIALNDMALSGHGVPGGRSGMNGSINIEGAGYYKATRQDLYLLAEMPEASDKSLQQVLDALGVLKEAAIRNDREDNVRFEEIAKAYREAATKPTLPEEARRFKVQYDGAMRDSSFNAAVDLLERANTVAPWWPDGYFDRGLILGQTGNYNRAMVAMKRYIALEPTAPDARAAQDRIYEWERKLLEEQQFARTSNGASPWKRHPPVIAESHAVRTAMMVILLTGVIGGAAIWYGATQIPVE